MGFFLDKVEKSDKCWGWTGLRYESGFGIFANREGIVQSAATIMFALDYRLDLDSNLSVTNLCKNRACVNPDHHSTKNLRSLAKKKWPAASEQTSRMPKMDDQNYRDTMISPIKRVEGPEDQLISKSIDALRKSKLFEEKSKIS